MVSKVRSKVSARPRRRLPGDMVDEYLTIECKTLRKIEKRINAASCDGYKVSQGIKRYATPETGKYYASTRFWAVMTKKVDPDMLTMALVDSELLDDKPKKLETTSGGDAGPPAAPAQIVHRTESRRG